MPDATILTDPALADPARKPQILGRGLKLSDGDLVFADGDLALVEGPENLLQGLGVMLETPLGSDPVHIAYGFDLGNVLLLPESPVLVRELIRLSIVKSLALDNRVIEVREVVFDNDPRFFELLPETLSPGEGSGGDAASDARHWRATAVVAVITESGPEELSLQLSGPGL